MDGNRFDNIFLNVISYLEASIFIVERFTKLEKNLKGRAQMNSQWMESAMVHTPHRRVNPSLINMGEGFINWGYIVVGQVVLLDDAGGILGYLVGNQPTLPLPAILSNAIN